MSQQSITSGESATPKTGSRFSRRAKIIATLLGILILAVVIPFGWWTLSPLFIDVAVREALTGENTVLRQGAFVGADDFLHHAEGTVKLVRSSADEWIVRFEDDFKASNGPDLYVWLVPESGRVQDGYVDLGRLKGNIGSQNYLVPADTDLSRYHTVIIWCKAFSILFGTARLP
jgi:hypothetical protein